MEALRLKGKTIGFVPTMGALHEGHLSLVRAARRENDIAVVSIFVNPLQFGPREDFKKYPRVMKQDSALLKKEKMDYLFSPEPEAMYSKKFSTIVEVSKTLTSVLCGKSRPGHFRGVTTVVAKLFHLAKPHRVYLGAKDYQQATVIGRMISDLNMDIEFRLMPTVRETDGLAMSSRNRYLNTDERARARLISQTLFWLRDEILSGRRDIAALKGEAYQKLGKKADSVDYLEIVDPETLQSLEKFQPAMVAAAACFVGKTRLIDNVIISPSTKKKKGF